MDTTKKNTSAKIIYSGNEGQIEEHPVEKSFIDGSPILLQQKSQTSQSLIDTMKKKLSIFKETLENDIQHNIPLILHDYRYAPEQAPSLMAIVMPLFETWFTKRFKDASVDDAFQTFVYRHFEIVFSDIVRHELFRLNNIYPNVRFQPIASISDRYEELFKKILKDTYKHIKFLYDEENKKQGKEEVKETMKNDDTIFNINLS